MLEFLNEQVLIEFFQGYAYRPSFVYMFIILFMTASSFGLPIPEEIILISAGLVAYMASHPELFPPPTPDAQSVELFTLSLVCFIAVLGSDFLIYLLGMWIGPKAQNTRLFKKLMPEKTMAKIDEKFKKYGHFASGIFRFTPGIRFPGHFSCGMMKVPWYKFLMVDGFFALISVPTQVYFVSIYGEVIISKLREIKLIVLSVLAIVFMIFLVRRFFFKKKHTS